MKVERVPLLNMKRNAISSYLSKQANYPQLISEPADTALGIVVVIPCYNEPAVTETLDSLAKCVAIDAKVEVLVVVNEGEDVEEFAHDQNQKSLNELRAWSNKNEVFDLFPLFVDKVPSKKAGVGYARKTGMDEAVRRLAQSESTHQIILCLDADSTVTSNYLQTVYDYFVKHPKCPAASIHYEHPLDNIDPKVNQAILEYELHLRYYVLAQRWSGLDYAHQTVGSSMAVRAQAYAAQGGMNTRKAGEDFYFIHKFTHYAEFGNVNNAMVIPSARVSDRVPFGTGRAMQSLMTNSEPLSTYAPQSFAAIAKLINQLPLLYEGEQEIKSSEPMSFFLGNHNYKKKMEELRNNTADYPAFRKRFFRWFDAFLCMKFLHFSRDHYNPNIPIGDAAQWLNQRYFKGDNTLGELDLLTKFRAESKAY